MLLWCETHSQTHKFLVGMPVGLRHSTNQTSCITSRD